ncbi:MAG: polysaccharide biosynthesis C-terminal domain-containing protein, partial [Minisyncoccales bacterium]
PYTLVRFLAGEKENNEIQDGFWSSMVFISAISLVSFIILNIFSEPLSGFFGQGKLFIQLLAFIILFSCLNELLFNMFRAFQQIKRYALFFIFQTSLEIGLISLALFLTHNLLSAIIAMLAARIMAFSIMVFLIVKKIGFTIPRFSRIKEHLAFGLPTIPINLSFWIVQSSNRYLIGIFMGTLYVGYYNPSSMISSSLSLLIAPLSFVLPATLSKLYDEKKIENVKIYLSYSLKYFLMLGIPSVVGLSVLSQPLLKTFSTPEIADHSYRILPLLACGILFCGIYTIFSQTIMLKKKTNIMGVIWVITAFLNFGLNLILIPAIGLLGAAIANFTAYALVLVLICYYSFKNITFPIDWKSILKSILASIAMAFIVYQMNVKDLKMIFVATIVGSIVYGILIFLFKGFNEREVSFLKGTFGKS